MSSRPKPTAQVAEPAAERPGWADIATVVNNYLYEIKSPLILQPEPAALTDGLDASCGIVDRV